MNAKTEPAPRFVLWIDGVGGYLVCEGQQVVLGQPVPGSPADVPILGDVSRNHATIRRSGEGYLIDPRRSVRIDGKSIASVASLSDGNLIELGSGGVKLRFRRPHPLSGTARLEFASRHRTQPAVDAVLLMARLVHSGAWAAEPCGLAAICPTMSCSRGGRANWFAVRRAHFRSTAARARDKDP